MILDKLLEKKDIFAYIEARSKDLLEDMANIENLPETKRESVKQKLKGRVQELDHLRIVIASGRLKDQAKHHWKNVRERKEHKSC